MFLSALAVTLSAVAVAVVLMIGTPKSQAGGVDKGLLIPSERADYPSELGSGDAPGVSVNERTLLDSMINRIGRQSFVGAELGLPPEGFHEDAASGQYGSRWLYLEARATDDEGGEVGAAWRAMLLAGAYRDAAHAADLPGVLGYTVQVRLPDGRLTGADSTAVDQPFGHKSPLNTFSAAALARSNAAGLPNTASTNTSVVSLRGPAVIESVVTTDPKQFLVDTHGSPQTAVFGDLGKFDGTLILVRDENGNLIYASGYAARVGSGAGWVNPRFGAPARGRATGH